MSANPKSEPIDDMIDDNSQDEQKDPPLHDPVKMKNISKKGGKASKTREEYLRDESWNGQDYLDYEDNEQ